MVIHQPRVSREPSEWVQTVAEVRAFGELARAKAALTTAPDAPRISGSKQCRWCRAKVLCPAITKELDATVIDDFKGIGTGFELAVVEEDDLAYYMDRVDMVEQWAKAVRAEVERRLTQGVAVTGYKLVEGRKGNRAWRDADDAEALLKSLRLKRDEMYDLKLISPTSAEKLLKVARPKVWAKVEAAVTRSEGKPSVALATDKAPALSLVATTADFVGLC